MPAIMINEPMVGLIVTFSISFRYLYAIRNINKGKQKQRNEVFALNYGQKPPGPLQDDFVNYCVKPAVELR